MHFSIFLILAQYTTKSNSGLFYAFKSALQFELFKEMEN